MAKLQPWYKVVTPREDLREGKPLDASEFAVHLDQVREGRANLDYQDPARFFDRTYLTKNLLGLAGEVVRRLSGEKTETSAVFNMATQFGGGKTHALTLLYHLANGGSKSKGWQGVDRILRAGDVSAIPNAATAVFVGTEFDSIEGRGGDDGTPKRYTPWGEIAFQLSGEKGFNVVSRHDAERTAPAGDVIRKFLPQDRPSLILVDELMNYISRSRKSGLSDQLHSFLHDLSEVVRGSDRAALVASIPASELEMTAGDQSDYERFKKLLDRVGKAVIMSAEAETSEIIRRRLFEWESRATSEDGRILLPKDATAICGEFADWIAENKNQVPSWFSSDHARAAFEATYPFHPMVLSVFERKWQGLPRFQQTRGILRLLALWVSHAYREGFKGAQKQPLIDLGSAPLDDPLFRSAVFEQLGESKLEGAVTTDIIGKKTSHAVRLDQEAVDTIKGARLHRRVATTVFFESNGGQSRNEATVPEIRLAVAGPDVDLGNVETALEALVDACYYLTTEKNCYRFSLKENLNKRFADRKASVRDEDIDKRVKEEIEKVFPSGGGVDRVFFPETSSNVPDRPSVTLVVMGPDQAIHDDADIQTRIEAMTREHGKSARTFKSALLWVVPESSAQMREEARKLLAWDDIRNEGLKLDDNQVKQLDVSIKRARRDLTESVWRAYKNVLLLNKENELQTTDLGLVTSSAAESLTKFILLKLRQSGEVEKEVSPRFLTRNWPPAFMEWSTKGVRDAFFASPQFPRLLDAETIKVTISRGVADGLFAYVGKGANGEYSPFAFKKPLAVADVEISDDMFIIPADEAEKRIKPPELARVLVEPSNAHVEPGKKQTFTAVGLDQFGLDYPIDIVIWTATGGDVNKKGVFSAGKDEGAFLVTAEVQGFSGTATVVITGDGPPPPPPAGTLSWTGEVPPQKWTNFYMKVLTKLVSVGDVHLKVTIEAKPREGVSDQLVEETKSGLRGQGLDDRVDVK